LTNGNGNRRGDNLLALPLFEIALVLVRLDHVASGIVSADHGDRAKAQKIRATGYLMWDDERNGSADVGFNYPVRQQEWSPSSVALDGMGNSSGDEN